jgi:hypothetical protein
LKNKRINPSYCKPGWDQITALSQAAFYGHSELVKTFLRLDVDYNTVNTGYTPFVWAVRNGHVEVVKVFLEEKSFKDLVADENVLEKLQQALLFFKIRHRAPDDIQKFEHMNRMIVEAQEASYGMIYCTF